jgi:hypothetical protein
MHLSTSDYAWKLYYVIEALCKNHCCKTFECCSMFVFLLFFSNENAKTKTPKTIDVENV